MYKAAKNLPADVERYVEEGLGQGMEESKAWAVAWSRYCKYKNPGSDHCKGSPGDYFPGREAAAKVEYPEYDPKITGSVRSIGSKSKQVLNEINTISYMMESRGGSPSLEAKIHRKYKDLYALGQTMVKLAVEVLSRFTGKVVSPQTGLRLRTLEDLCDNLKDSKMEIFGMSFRISQAAEKLYGDISGVGAVLDNLWDRSTKNTSRVAHRYLLAATLKPATVAKINKLIASLGMDGKSIYPTMARAWADLQMVALRRNHLFINMESIPKPTANGSATLRVYTTYGGESNASLIVTWRSVEGGFRVESYLG